MKASLSACCCCSAKGRRVGWRMAPVWMPPVTVKFAASAASPGGSFRQRGHRRKPFQNGEIGRRLRCSLKRREHASDQRGDLPLPEHRPSRPVVSHSLRRTFMHPIRRDEKVDASREWSKSRSLFARELF